MKFRVYDVRKKIHVNRRIDDILGVNVTKTGTLIFKFTDGVSKLVSQNDVIIPSSVDLAGHARRSGSTSRGSRKTSKSRSMSRAQYRREKSSGMSDSEDSDDSDSDGDDSDSDSDSDSDESDTASVKSSRSNKSTSSNRSNRSSKSNKSNKSNKSSKSSKSKSNKRKSTKIRGDRLKAFIRSNRGKEFKMRHTAAKFKAKDINNLQVLYNKTFYVGIKGVGGTIVSKNSVTVPKCLRKLVKDD